LTETKAKTKRVPEPSQAEYVAQDRSTREVLEAQPKVRVRLFQFPKDSSDKPLPPVDVSVNGCVFRIERGIPTEVPETVAEILYESGYA
jgi:hypothetical protein